MSLFTVRDEQLEVLQQLLVREFEKRSLADLRSRFSEKLAGVRDEAVLSMIRIGMSKAGSYGIINETDLGRYFEYLVEYGPNFDTALSWAAEILGCDWMTGFEKMNALDNLTTFELRTIR